ncbi:MAG: tetratricopeptide repeat protein [Bacteroidota bacterium]
MPIAKAQIKSIQELVAKDRLGQALTQLAALVDAHQESSVQSWKEPLIQLRADLERYENAQLTAEMSNDEAQARKNQLNGRSLRMLREMAAGKSYQPSIGSNGSTSAGRWPLVVLLAFVAGGLGWWLWPREAALPTVIEGQLCPEFEADQDFNILVLPFAPIIGNTPNSLHRQVTRSLAQFAAEYTLEVDTRPSGQTHEEIDNYPIIPEDADEIGRRCGSNLVIWGEVEDGESEDITSTSYRFVDIDDWGIEQLQLDENVQVASAPSLLELSSSGQLTANIEEQLAKLFSVIAALRNPVAAIEVIEENMASPEDGELYEMQQLMLAQAYHEKGDDEAAIATYTRVIEHDQSNWTAWQNRGTLRFQAQEYEAAVDDFSTVAEEKPTNDQLRYSLALANLRAGHLQAAEREYYYLTERPEVTAPNNDQDTTQVDPGERDTPAEVQNISPAQIRVLQEGIQRQQLITNDRIQAGRANLQAQPGQLNVFELRLGMQAAYEAGRYEDAAQLSERLISENPDDGEALKVATESYNATGNTSRVRQLINLAEERGLQENLQLQLREPVQLQTIEAERIQVSPRRIRRQ